MTIAQAKIELKTIGFSLHKICGEYKVYPKGTIGQAYFTNDISDAVNTAYAMANDIRIKYERGQ